MQFRHYIPLLTVLLLFIPLLVLDGCSRFTEKPRRPVIAKSVQAEQYITHQALAELALEQNSNAKMIAQQIKTLNAPVSNKEKIRQEITQAVLIMEYTLKGESRYRQLLVPVAVTEDMPAFKYIRQVGTRLGQLPYTLRNLHAYYISIAWPPLEKFTAGELPQQLAAGKQKMLAGALPLSSYENARLQVQLAEFFLKTRVRDAAYLALENAKADLAMVAEETPAVDIAELLRRTDAVEVRLHKEMPYKL